MKRPAVSVKPHAKSKAKAPQPKAKPTIEKKKEKEQKAKAKSKPKAVPKKHEKDSFSDKVQKWKLKEDHKGDEPESDDAGESGKGDATVAAKRGLSKTRKYKRLSDANAIHQHNSEHAHGLSNSTWPMISNMHVCFSQYNTTSLGICLYPDVIL